MSMYFDEYKWALSHPSSKLAQAFLALDWGGHIDRERADYLSERIKEKFYIEELPKVEVAISSWDETRKAISYMWNNTITWSNSTGCTDSTPIYISTNDTSYIVTTSNFTGSN
jgi:hypothetical protein